MSERKTDADGVWEETPQPSGAIVRVLVEPSEEYLSKRAQRAQEKEAREANRQAAEQAKKDAMKNARSIGELRDALVNYLGIE